MKNMNYLTRIWTVIYTCLCWNYFSYVEGNALLRPVSRGVLWTRRHHNPTNYNYMGVNCGGIGRYRRNDGQCGLCGDAFDGPRRHEFGGKFATGVISRTYKKGQTTMGVKILVNSNQGGYFEFRVCEANGKRETQACFDKHLLGITEARSQNEIDRFYPEGTGIIHLTLEIPPGLACKQCILQWKYTTDNAWGRDSLGRGCLGCGHQETFINCADIRIHGWNVAPTTPPTLPPTTPTEPPTTPPTTTTTPTPPPTTTTTTVKTTTKKLTPSSPVTRPSSARTTANIGSQRTDRGDEQRSITPAWTQSGNRVTNIAPQTPLDLHIKSQEKAKRASQAAPLRPSGRRGPPPGPPPKRPIPRPPRLSPSHIEALNSNSKLHIHTSADNRPYIHLHSDTSRRHHHSSASAHVVDPSTKLQQPSTTKLQTTPIPTRTMSMLYSSVTPRASFNRQGHLANRNESRRARKPETHDPNRWDQSIATQDSVFNEYGVTERPKLTVKPFRIASHGQQSPNNRHTRPGFMDNKRPVFNRDRQHGGFDRSRQHGGNLRHRVGNVLNSHTTSSPSSRHLSHSHRQRPLETWNLQRDNQYSRYSLNDHAGTTKSPLNQRDNQRTLTQMQRRRNMPHVMLDPMGEPIVVTSTTTVAPTPFNRFAGTPAPLRRELDALYDIRNKLKADSELHKFRKPAVFERFTRFKVGKGRQPVAVPDKVASKIGSAAEANEVVKVSQEPAYRHNVSSPSSSVSSNAFNPHLSSLVLSQNGQGNIHGVDFLSQKPQRNEFAHMKHTNTIDKSHGPGADHGHVPIVISGGNDGGHSSFNGVLGLYAPHNASHLHGHVGHLITTTRPPYLQGVNVPIFGHQSHKTNQHRLLNHGLVPDVHNNNRMTTGQDPLESRTDNRQILMPETDIQRQAGQVFDKTVPPVASNLFANLHGHAIQTQDNAFKAITPAPPNPYIERIKSNMLASINRANNHMMGGHAGDSTLQAIPGHFQGQQSFQANTNNMQPLHDQQNLHVNNIENQAQSSQTPAVLLQQQPIAQANAAQPHQVHKSNANAWLNGNNQQVQPTQQVNQALRGPSGFQQPSNPTIGLTQQNLQIQNIQPVQPSNNVLPNQMQQYQVQNNVQQNQQQLHTQVSQPAMVSNIQGVLQGANTNAAQSQIPIQNNQNQWATGALQNQGTKVAAQSQTIPGAIQNRMEQNTFQTQMNSGTVMNNGMQGIAQQNGPFQSQGVTGVIQQQSMQGLTQNQVLQAQTQGQFQASNQGILPNNANNGIQKIQNMFQQQSIPNVVPSSGVQYNVQVQKPNGLIQGQSAPNSFQQQFQQNQQSQITQLANRNDVQIEQRVQQPGLNSQQNLNNANSVGIAFKDNVFTTNHNNVGFTNQNNNGMSNQNNIGMSNQNNNGMSYQNNKGMSNQHGVANQNGVVIATSNNVGMTNQNIVGMATQNNAGIGTNNQNNIQQLSLQNMNQPAKTMTSPQQMVGVQTNIQSNQASVDHSQQQHSVNTETSSAKDLLLELKKLQELQKQGQQLSYDQLQLKHKLQVQLLQKLHEQQVKRLDTKNVVEHKHHVEKMDQASKGNNGVGGQATVIQSHEQNLSQQPETRMQQSMVSNAANDVIDQQRHSNTNGNNQGHSNFIGNVQAQQSGMGSNFQTANQQTQLIEEVHMHNNNNNNINKHSNANTVINKAVNDNQFQQKQTVNLPANNQQMTNINDSPTTNNAGSSQFIQSQVNNLPTSNLQSHNRNNVQMISNNNQIQNNDGRTFQNQQSNIPVNSNQGPIVNDNDKVQMNPIQDSSVSEPTESKQPGAGSFVKPTDAAPKKRLDRLVDQLTDKMNDRMAQRQTGGQSSNGNASPVSRDAIMKMLREMALDAVKQNQNQEQKERQNANTGKTINTINLNEVITKDTSERMQHGSQEPMRTKQNQFQSRLPNKSYESNSQNGNHFISAKLENNHNEAHAHDQSMRHSNTQANNKDGASQSGNHAHGHAGQPSHGHMDSIDGTLRSSSLDHAHDLRNSGMTSDPVKKPTMVPQTVSNADLRKIDLRTGIRNDKENTPSGIRDASLDLPLDGIANEHSHSSTNVHKSGQPTISGDKHISEQNMNIGQHSNRDVFSQRGHARPHPVSSTRNSKPRQKTITLHPPSEIKAKKQETVTNDPLNILGGHSNKHVISNDRGHTHSDVQSSPEHVDKQSSTNNHQHNHVVPESPAPRKRLTQQDISDLGNEILKQMQKLLARQRSRRL